mgnify:CR=1 FL=1|tara:strand:- start:499 stop:897 length:399 start_codon:yes stop_codon:yes gene_type:complete
MYEQHKELIWFVIGVFTYRALTAVLVYGHLANFVEKINHQCLTVLGIAAADLSLAREMKYKHLHKSSVSESDLAELQELDERVFANWKASVIGNFLMHFPKNYRFVIKYEDWDGAMKELDRVYKKDIKRRRA